MGTQIRRGWRSSHRMAKSISARRKTGNSSVISERRGIESGETKVRPTHNQSKSKVQMFAPSKKPMAIRLKRPSIFGPKRKAFIFSFLVMLDCI